MKEVVIRRVTGTLPSRAADNLFWLGRYLERGEATLRLVRALLGRLIDPDPAPGRNDTVRPVPGCWPSIFGSFARDSEPASPPSESDLAKKQIAVISVYLLFFL